LPPEPSLDEEYLWTEIADDEKRRQEEAELEKYLGIDEGETLLNVLQ